MIGNLLPCCKRCNSEKGNKNYKDFLLGKTGNKKQAEERIKKITAYIQKYIPEELSYEEIKNRCPEEIDKYEKLKDEIFSLMREADSVATAIRGTVKIYEKN